MTGQVPLSVSGIRPFLYIGTIRGWWEDDLSTEPVLRSPICADLSFKVVIVISFIICHVKLLARLFLFAQPMLCVTACLFVFEFCLRPLVVQVSWSLFMAVTRRRLAFSFEFQERKLQCFRRIPFFIKLLVSKLPGVTVLSTIC